MVKAGKPAKARTKHPVDIGINGKQSKASQGVMDMERGTLGMPDKELGHGSDWNRFGT